MSYINSQTKIIATLGPATSTRTIVSEFIKSGVDEPSNVNPAFWADSICFNAAKLAKQVGAKAIIVFTHSGYSAIRISSHRPKSKIYAFTNNKDILCKISLVWGLKSYYLETYEHLDQAISVSVKILKNKNILAQGDCVVYVGTTPLKLQGSTNMMKIAYV